MIQVNTGSLRATVLAMRGHAGLVDVARRRMLEEAGGVLHRACRTNISLTDHTLNDLARLDHPYARRHGSIQSSSLGHGRPLEGDHGDSLVHSQGGAGVRSLRGMIRADENSYAVWVDLSAAPHMRYVIEGTRRMFGRDVLWLTATDEVVQLGMRRAIVRVLGKEMRVKAALRFG